MKCTAKTIILVSLFMASENAIASCADRLTRSSDADFLIQCIVEMSNEINKIRLKQNIAINELIPRGAVIPFEKNECPSGWEKYTQATGRMIIGAGRSDGLTARTYLEKGGEEKHKLDISEMPNHLHGGTFRSSGFSFEHHQNNSRLPGQIYRFDRNTTPTGGGAAHNNMPPYIALTYCIKIR